MRAFLALAVAVPVVVYAGCRLAVLERRLPLDTMVGRLRRVRRLPAALAVPGAYAAVVDRLLRWLPPHRRMGRCVKRSLLLLELLSRCGLAPTFHYGVGRDEAGVRRAHAWLGGVAPGLPTGAPEAGYVETLVV